MADITTIAELGTAGGTLVLALATYASVRSSNRSARVAERALMIRLRPTLVPSRPGDPVEDVAFAETETLHVPPGEAVVKHKDDRLLMAMTLRNVGSGLAVLQGWYMLPSAEFARREHTDPDDFRNLARDIYIAAGDVGFWQGAIRDNSDPLHGEVGEIVGSGQRLIIELLYTDEEHAQRFISRFALMPNGDHWTVSVGRHWRLD